MSILKRKRPALLFVVIYVLGLAVNAVGNFVWSPAETLAIVLALVGSIGAATVSANVLVTRQATDRGFMWCGIVGGSLATAYQVLVLSDPDSNPILAFAGIFVGWALLAMGAFARSERLTPAPRSSAGSG
ncbi:hypothetical protein [Nocardioides aurantiacus]|uniref:hypothetical protein n=1 Tax=Nocardioides aurantiacus TaxID=86796 RepID=UPI0011CD8529|nr:hypothetical protein [Nocardioides aurantiacus]